MKNIQIPEKLFLDLIKYHMLRDIYTEEELKTLQRSILKHLEDKIDAIVKRDLYTKYKTSPNEEEKEKYRLKYLKAIGMAEDFIW